MSDMDRANRELVSRGKQHMFKVAAHRINWNAVSGNFLPPSHNTPVTCRISRTYGVEGVQNPAMDARCILNCYWETSTMEWQNFTARNVHGYVLHSNYKRRGNPPEAFPPGTPCVLTRWDGFVRFEGLSAPDAPLNVIVLDSQVVTREMGTHIYRIQWSEMAPLKKKERHYVEVPYHRLAEYIY